MEWTRPLPNIDPDNAPFWDGLREHQFLLFTCKDCGNAYWPMAYCRSCRAEPSFGNMIWAPASGHGTVFAFNIHRRAFHPGFADAIPYVFALIELEEGPMFGSNVVGCAPDAVRIGMRVRVSYQDVEPDNADPFTLALFEPA